MSLVCATIVELCRDVFETLQETNDSGLPVSKLPDFIRVLGFNPTDLELSHVCSDLPTDRHLAFFEVLPIVHHFEKRQTLERISASVLLERLDCIGNGQGNLPEREFRRLLTSLGEPLTHTEVSEVFEGCVDHRGLIDKISFCGTIMDSTIGSYLSV